MYLKKKYISLVLCAFCVYGTLHSMERKETRLTITQNNENPESPLHTICSPYPYPKPTNTKMKKEPDENEPATIAFFNETEKLPFFGFKNLNHLNFFCATQKALEQHPPFQSPDATETKNDNPNSSPSASSLTKQLNNQSLLVHQAKLIAEFTNLSNFTISNYCSVYKYLGLLYALKRHAQNHNKKNFASILPEYEKRISFYDEMLQNYLKSKHLPPPPPQAFNPEEELYKQSIYLTLKLKIRTQHKEILDTYEQYAHNKIAQLIGK